MLAGVGGGAPDARSIVTHYFPLFPAVSGFFRVFPGSSGSAIMRNKSPNGSLPPAPLILLHSDSGIGIIYPVGRQDRINRTSRRKWHSMNALFNRIIYGKEGPDITKDEPEKRAFFRFWEIAWNKRFKLIGINFMYFICNLLPTAIAAAGYMLAVSFYYTLSRGISVWKAIGESERPDQAMVMYYMGLAFVTIFMNIIPVFSAGPFRSGLTFVTRAFVRREPVFLWHDYITKTRSNLGLSIKAMLINGFIGVWDMILIAFYLACSAKDSNMTGVMPNWLLFISAAIAIFTTALLLMMSMYIYPMIVTFKLTLRQLYKNAVIFALIKWLPNLGIMLLTAAMVLLPLLLINGYFAFIVSLLLYATIGQAFTAYLQTFFVYPTLKKYMIDNPKADKSKENGSEEADENGAPADADDTDADNSDDDSAGADNDGADDPDGSGQDGPQDGNGAETETGEKWVYPGL